MGGVRLESGGQLGPTSELSRAGGGAVSLARSYERVTAAFVAGLLLLVPLLLAGLPQLATHSLPGSYTRADAIIVFFASVPLLFIALAAYRVAQYRGLVGVEEDAL